MYVTLMVKLPSLHSVCSHVCLYFSVQNLTREMEERDLQNQAIKTTCKWKMVSVFSSIYLSWHARSDFSTICSLNFTWPATFWWGIRLKMMYYPFHSSKSCALDFWLKIGTSFVCNVFAVYICRLTKQRINFSLMLAITLRSLSIDHVAKRFKARVT